MIVSVTGIHETIENLERVEQDLSRMVKPMRDATIAVTRDAKINAPHKFGELRASITPGVDSNAFLVVGVVGSNVEYAGYQELGTRYIRARRYLGRALDANRQKIMQIFNSAIARIVK